MPGWPQRCALRRRAWLILVVLVHLLVLYAWPGAQPMGHPAGALHDSSHDTPLDIVFVVPAPTPLPVRQAPTAAPRTPVPKRAAMQRDLAQPQPPVTLITPPPAAEPALEAALSAVTHDTLRQSALAAAGAIDRQLRKESLDLGQRALLRAGQPERGIAAALVPRGPDQIEELVMADGRRISRVGNKCAYKESNALTRGRDVIQHGVRTIWGDCRGAR